MKTMVQALALAGALGAGVWRSPVRRHPHRLSPVPSARFGWSKAAGS